MAPNTQSNEKVVKIEVKKSTCKDCKLECPFKGKEDSPRIKDLGKTPQECFYKKEFEKTTASLVRNLDQHVNVLRSAMVGAQPMLSMISQQEIKAIAEMNRYYQEQLKAIAASFDMYKIAGIARDAALVYKGVQFQLDSLKEIANQVSFLTLSYFSPRELRTVERAISIPEKSLAAKLIERISRCPKGKEGWLEFQDLCKKTLTYLFVPPLVDPFEQSRTETGLHIRDLVFDIPYSVKEFWGYIRDKFCALALVVEVKNYSLPVEGNQIVISSKYLGKKRLGVFGIVLSRVDPAESAVKEVKRLWIDDDKLILCLKDGDLIKMLELKEKGKSPEMVVDSAIRQFLRNLE